MTKSNDEMAIVTGGTKGIGRAVAEEFASKDITTIATYHADEEAASRAEDLLEEYEGQTTTKKFDVGDFDEVQASFREIQEEFGHPSILVNNAGIMRNNLLPRMRQSDWDEVLTTNLTGTFHCTREASRYMLRRGSGRIVNVSSIAGQRGYGGQSNYAASKAGLIGFTRAVAKEFSGKDIRINAVCPGFTETDLLGNGIADAQSVRDVGREDIEANIPTNEIASPAQIAKVIEFLSSPDSSYINGEIIRVDGGLLA